LHSLRTVPRQLPEPINGKGTPNGHNGHKPQKEAQPSNNGHHPEGLHSNGRHPLIQLHQVSKVYSTAAGDFQALKGITTDIHPGEFLGIIGKSGSGKSTLLNMITGVDHLTSGEVTFNGADGHEPVSVHSLSENDLALWRGRTLGIVYQSFQLLPMLSLVDNILLPMDLCGLYNPRQSRERTIELLKLVELEEHANKLPGYISGGQQQRAAIARALANDPTVLVADEPTGNLDSVTAETIFRMFETLVQNGKTIIMVTHDKSLASRFSRRIYISDGRLIDETEYQTERGHKTAIPNRN
jgi:putative ABC transport system ATP-binding protein